MIVSQRTQPLTQRRGSVLSNRGIQTSRTRQSQVRAIDRQIVIRNKQIEKAKTSLNTSETKLKEWIKQKIAIEKKWISSSENYSRNQQVYWTDYQRARDSFNWGDLTPRERTELRTSLKREYEGRIAPAKESMEKAKIQKQRIDTKGNELQTGLYDNIKKYYKLTGGEKSEADKTIKDFQSNLSKTIRSGTAQEYQRQHILNAQAIQRAGEKRRRASTTKPTDLSQSQLENWIITGKKPAPISTTYRNGKIVSQKFYEQEKTIKRNLFQVGSKGEPQSKVYYAQDETGNILGVSNISPVTNKIFKSMTPIQKFTLYGSTLFSKYGTEAVVKGLIPKDKTYADVSKKQLQDQQTMGTFPFVLKSTAGAITGSPFGIYATGSLTGAGVTWFGATKTGSALLGSIIGKVATGGLTLAYGGSKVIKAKSIIDKGADKEELALLGVETGLELGVFIQERKE